MSLPHQATLALKDLRLRRAAWAVALLLVVGLLMSAMYRRSREPKLVTYTTPTMDSYGHRMTLLVPDGWRAEPLRPVAVVGGLANQVVIQEPGLPDWIPSRIRDWLRHGSQDRSLTI